MKKFTTVSLCSAILALGAQALCFYAFLAKYIVLTYSITFLHALTPTADFSTMSKDNSWDNVMSVFGFLSLGLAIVSLLAAITSFIKREAGWRFLPVTLLILYLMTCLAVLCWAKS
jgi:hypothetical protein